jgi:LPXTG-motif cell wall-anchored protein
MKPTTRLNAGRLATFAAAVTAVGLFGLASPAQAEEPTAESRTVVTNLVDRADHGSSNPTATWALDTFTRTVEITGGPDYVRHQQPSLAADEPEVPADIVEQVAEAKKEQNPEFNVCDLVKKFHLRWEYHADVTDKGTFKTLAGADLSPRAGDALVGDVPGTLNGGFTADFTAPAHWCSFDDSKLNGKTLDGDDAPATPKWLECLFGDKLDGSPINDDWSWTYKTCVEQWVDAADNNDGQDESAGDIVGKPCPTPAPTTTAPPVVVTNAQLPVTGASVSTVVVVGGALILLGAGALIATRRRRTTA